MNKILSTTAVAKALLLSMFLVFRAGVCQGEPPPMPPGMPCLLNSWTLSAPPWSSDFDDLARGYTGLNAVPSWSEDGTCLSVDTNTPAYLNLPVYEGPYNYTNISMDSSNGSLLFWYQANYTSVADGGAGISNWAALLNIGAYTTNASIGDWLLAIDPPASNLLFLTASNGSRQIIFKCPIVIDAGDWWQFVISWSATNTCLYTNGQLATNCESITYRPSYSDCLDYGFFVGSMGTNGDSQARGKFQNLASYNYPLTAEEVANDYATVSAVILNWGGTMPGGGGFHRDGGGPPSPGGSGGLDTNGGGGGGEPAGTNDPPSYSSNQFWLEPLSLGTNAFNSDPDALTFILWDTTNSASYELQSVTVLTDTTWTPQQIFVGASGQNWTSITFHMSGQTTLFFRAIVYSQDTTDSGLPDWWKLEYGLNPNSVSSGTNGVSDAYSDPAGDGWTDLQKFQNGMNPNTFYTPPAPIVTVAPLPGDNGVLISWEPSLGNVTGYIVYRNGSAISSVLPATQTSYQDNGVSVSAASANSGSLPAYQVVAQYSSPSGTVYSSASFPQTPASANMAMDVALLRGPEGQYYLAAPSIPNTVTNLRIFRQAAYSEYPNVLFDIYSQPMTNFNSTASVSYWDFPTNEFVNGMCPVPQSFLPYYNSLYLTYVTMGPNGTIGPATTVTSGFFQYAPQRTGWFNYQDWQVFYSIGNSSDWYNYEVSSLATQIGGEWGNTFPFLDGTTQLRQNLVFQLETADELNALQFSVEAIYPDPRPTVFPLDGSSDVFFLNNYAWANFHTRYGDSVALVDEFKPFEDNYFYRNFIVQSESDLNSDGSLASGVFYAGGGPVPPPPTTPYGSPYYVQIPNQAPFAFPDYAYVASEATNPPSPLLSTNSQLVFSTWPAYGNIGASYNNSWGLTLASGQYNIFGLPYQSLTEYYSDGTNLYSQTYAAGQTIVDAGASNGYACFYYPQVSAPRLQTVGYYFGENDRDYLPGDPGFAPTTGTPAPIIATPGTPLLIGAWAEESVDGSTNMPGFLEQYFDKSYSWNFLNGQTTNSLGVLSEYGEFFPTDPGLAVLTTKTNSGGGYGTVEVPVIGLYADRNHDGVIDTSFSGPDFCTPSRPFQFWVNDDNDSGDTGGDDIPGEPASLGLIPNGVSGMVNGTRDLIDFFPVDVDIEGMLETSNLSYVSLIFRLSQADGALNFLTTALGTNNLLQYLTDTNYASILANAPVTQITSNGVTLGLDFFNTVNLGNGGVILVEARTNTTAPLVLDILTNGYIIAEAQLPLNITGVEQMFRHVNLTPAVLGRIDGPPSRLTGADVPNALDDNGANFIFLHGYNVNPNQARGTESEAFKRMYWSGSHARFYGVTWDGYQSQGVFPTALGTIQTPSPVSPNYHTNVANAFQAAPDFAAFIESLSGTNIVAAHSLGNMVVLSALNDYGANIQTYFMIDAVVAMEAFDTTGYPNEDMIVADWASYTNSLYASYWHNLFGNLDFRSKLAWPGRLSLFNNAQVYNFYSSGEEVLRSWPEDPPANILSGAAQIFWDYYYSQSPLGSYVWVWQEKAKGIAATNVFLGSDHGGWKFNTNYDLGTNLMSPAQAATLPAGQLQTNAFFDFGSPDFSNDYAVEGSLGNVYAYENNNRMLGDAMPALSYPAGANHVTRLAPQGQPNRNFDMQASFENGWPSGRPLLQVGASAAGEWHHSDYQAVAYTYTYKLFNEMVTLGNLK